MGNFETLKEIVTNAQQGKELNVEGGLEAIKGLKKVCFQKNVYNLTAALNLPQDDLKQARDFHELAIFFYVLKEDFKEFEKNFYRVQFFYKELANKIGATSTNYDVVQGIYLLFLLSFNRISEFHLFLSSIPVEKHSNPLYSYSIKLERDITIGNYLSSDSKHDQTPSTFFKVFYNRIFETIRYEIFRSLEASVDEIKVIDILRILKLDNEAVLETALTKEEENSKKRGFQWIIQGDTIKIEKLSKIETNINADEVIKKMLIYSHELETIH